MVLAAANNQSNLQAGIPKSFHEKMWSNTQYSNTPILNTHSKTHVWKFDLCWFLDDFLFIEPPAKLTPKWP